MSFRFLNHSRFDLVRWLSNRFMQLIIYPSIWVAGAIASLGLYIQEILGLEHNPQAIALIFVTALIPYNLDRIFDSYVQEIPDRQAQLFFRQPYIWILLLGAIATTIGLLYHAPSRVRYVSIAGIIPLLYGAPLFPWKSDSKKRWYRLKDIPGSKAWIVGSILTYAVVALPMAYGNAEFDSRVASIGLFMFVFIVTNSHVFDIRDLESDRQKEVTTLPIMVGVRGTKLILTIMNLFVVILVVYGWTTNVMVAHPEMILAIAVNLIYIWLVNIDTPRWVYSIWIEGFLFVPILGYRVILNFPFLFDRLLV